jgi:hypothetical protein
MGAPLMAVVAVGERRRVYLPLAEDLGNGERTGDIARKWPWWIRISQPRRLGVFLVKARMVRRFST